MNDVKILNIHDITRISDSSLKYKDNGEQSICLKESAEIWWETHHRKTFLSTIQRKKQKNKYVGNKVFYIGGISYIELYSRNGRIRFLLEVPETNGQNSIAPFREKWEKINIALHKEGYWLFDMN